MIDLSEILPCPNCNSKPRMTGHRAGKPVKIRCSNKSCELSRESVPTGFWQGINRELDKAYAQFRESLLAKEAEVVEFQPILAGIVYHYENADRSVVNDNVMTYNESYRPLFIASRDYYLRHKT